MLETTLAKVIHTVSLCLDEKIEIHKEQSLVDDLQFDSLRMATLSASLEETFDHYIFLHDWIATAEYTSMLTIDSLTSFITTELGLCSNP